MESLRSGWFALERQRKIIVVLATVAVFLAVLALSRIGSDREMALLYAGLENGAAGEVVQALEAQGVPYEVRGGAIYVEAGRRDILRMTLASEGLPANGGQGYELLDALSGFGTTSQMFDAAYWRAKEGELARTILSIPHVRSARVHISTPSSRPFQRDQRATAAVTVSTSGESLSVEHARALRHLVASAVTGLAPEDVAVIDSEGGLIAAEEGPGSVRADERAAEMRERVQRLLEARVGRGNAVVEIAVATETETEQIVERRFDPEGRVAISTEIEERSSNSTSTGGGEVTVASNLPDGDATSGRQSQSRDAETRQLTNYEVSETQREILRVPGAIRRLTVAVLINEPVASAGDGTVMPRSSEELEALRALVASAVGFDESRGDVITLQSMPFEAVEPLGTEVTAPVMGASLDLMRLIQLGVLALVALVLGLFVVRPILASRRPPALPANLPAALEGEAAAPMALPGVENEDAPWEEASDFDIEAAFGGGTEEDLSDLDPVARLRRLMEERQEETLRILQSWVEDPDPAERA